MELYEPIQLNEGSMVDSAAVSLTVCNSTDTGAAGCTDDNFFPSSEPGEPRKQTFARSGLLYKLVATNDRALAKGKKIPRGKTNPNEARQMDMFTVYGLNATEPKPLSIDAKKMLALMTSSEARKVMRTDKITTYRLTLSDYMQSLGLKDREYALEKAESALTELREYHVDYQDKKRKASFNVFFGYMIETEGREKILSVSFLNDCHDFLKRGTMSFPPSITALSNKNPDSFILPFVCRHHEESNAGRRGANVMSVQALLDASTLPPDSTVRKKTEKIRTPFEKSLNEAQSTQDFHWEYTGTLPEDFNSFKKAKIKYNFPNLPTPKPVEKKIEAGKCGGRDNNKSDGKDSHEQMKLELGNGND